MRSEGWNWQKLQNIISNCILFSKSCVHKGHNFLACDLYLTRQADVVQRDALQLLGITGWRRRAENRNELRRLKREAKARKGL